MRVFLNPGHAPDGNPDPGAVGPTGLRECDVVLLVSDRIADYLEQVGIEVQVMQNDSLEMICAASNLFNADAFISIHCNSAGSVQARGTEIYTTRGVTEADNLATAIMGQISSAFSNLAVRSDYSDGDVDKEAGFYVLKYTDAPAVLIELAFISNRQEEKLLADPVFQRDIAAAIARGVTDWQSQL